MTHPDGLSIRVEDLHKSFRGGRDHVLQGVNLEFKPGKLTYILGPSGTGKSVTIKHILGLLRPDSGRIFIGDDETTHMRGRELEAKRALFGMLFQNAALFDDRTVFDNVAFPLYEHTKMKPGEIAERVTKTLAALGMPDGHDKLPNELSGGMRKRVGLARAIVRQPQALLYDEPTTGLDPVTRTMVDDLIAQLKRDLKLTSIVISHDIPSALQLADHIAFLFGGKVVFYGSPAEFRACSHPAVQNFMTAELRAAKSVMS